MSPAHLVTMDAVVVSHVSKIFGRGKEKFNALDDVSFSIKKGEIFGLLGPNGAGKSTLINILSTALLSDKGKATILGHDVIKDRYQVLEAVNRATGETTFHYLMKVREIVRFYSKMYDIKDREKKIKDLSEKLEFRDLLDKNFNNLSSGQKIRVILGVSLINSPKVLLLDEPTIGMDPDISRKTRELITRVNKEEGTTILLTSHYMQEVEELCGRIAFINHGKILDVGTTKLVKKAKLGTEVKISLKEIKEKQWLQKEGFSLDGKDIMKKVDDESEIAEILESLADKGMVIIDLSKKEPSLEDYFIRMMKR